MHLWLLKLDLVIFIIAAVAVQYEGMWIAPVLSFVLFILTCFVVYLGGEWNEEEKSFDIDSLFTILLFALILSGGIAFYSSVFGGVEGWSPFLNSLVLRRLCFLLPLSPIFLNRKTKRPSRASMR